MTRLLPALTATVFAALLTASAIAQPPDSVVDLTPQFRSAALPIANLQVYEVGGIVIIRGSSSDRAVAEQIGVIVQSAGYDRVANLVQMQPPPDDAALRRAAERQLALHRTLDGSKLRIDAKDGVIHVAGTVADDTQRDAVIALLRTVDGVRGVKADLTR